VQTRGVRGQKIPKNANVICERPLIENWVFEPTEDILVHLLFEELFHPLNKYLGPEESQIKIMGQ